MRVTALKQQVKDQNRVSVYVDEKYSFSLTLDQLLEQKLKKGDELTDERLADLKKLSDEGKLRARALDWVLGRPHSTKEFQDYLYRKKASKEYIQQLVAEFSERGYLNDLAYATWFIELKSRKNKSKRAITAELYAKGVSPVTIQSVVASDAQAVNDTAALSVLVNKLRKRSRYQDPQKLITYLAGRGFSYTDIKQAMELDDLDPQLQ